MTEQRHTFTADTQVAVHGYSDDTFGVYWVWSWLITGDDDDSASGSERWVRMHFPDGSGLIVQGRRGQGERFMDGLENGRMCGGIDKAEGVDL